MTTLNSKPFLFDRRRAKKHPWLDALNKLEKSNVPGNTPLAKNWRMDSHVDFTREQHLKDSGCFPKNGEVRDFGASIREYFEHFQCRSPITHPCASYVEVENASNLIPVDKRPSRNHYFLHLASLNRLLRYIYRGGNETLVDFQIAVRRLTNSRPPSDTTDAEIERLTGTLQSKGAEAVKAFARIVSDALGNSEPLWWASFAHEIGDLSGTLDWTNAVQKTGLGHFERGEWLMAWYYSPEIVGKLYRPTTAEAGTSGFYFPSPPTSICGITMPLIEGMPAVRELIHAPLKGEVSEEACIGNFGRIENNPIELKDANTLLDWFEERRRTHGSYLVQQSPHIAIYEWLQRHQVLS